jgi:hypothetical protein
MKLSNITKAKIMLAIVTACTFLAMSIPVLAGPPTHG